MAGVPRMLFLLLLAITSQVSGQPCIQTSLRTTGARQGLDLEFEVEIKNVCTCAQRGVRIDAPGFASQKLVEPKIFRRDGTAFLVNGGNPIPGGGAVKFTYWWDHAAHFSLAGSLPAC
ncbi:unnamed protein product [Spirodela intermedia]|uniref:Uncharacterized protein n=1 Tax=Spirodela intermedia TaxID=51605 RepID=A0A7I8JA31_SPIIN|nr:unnamed protein product [Spirodela intermedia]CAA6666954.1 unnamed protein product [Spirodela intermedia]